MEFKGLENMAKLLKDAKALEQSAQNGLLFCEELMNKEGLNEEQKREIEVAKNRIMNGLKDLDNVNNNWK